jgi:hypothetical protein
MTAAECLRRAKGLGAEYQRAVNAFIDDFRRAPPGLKAELVRDPIVSAGQLEALVAAVVSSLCTEAAIDTPTWSSTIQSPTPFFVLPAASFEMRVLLMLEAPPPFRNRRVFVPENYMSRA